MIFRMNILLFLFSFLPMATPTWWRPPPEHQTTRSSWLTRKQAINDERLVADRRNDPVVSRRFPDRSRALQRIRAARRELSVRTDQFQETDMAKSASKASGAGSRSASDKTSRTDGRAKSPKSAPRKAVALRVADDSSDQDSSDERGNAAVEMFLKLLQSPIVADLLAVAATAALAALAEHGFNRGGGAAEGKRAGKAVKAAGKAAAAAVGRRLATEVDEIRKAAKSKSEAEA
jgi:hypothetical protein